MFFEKGDIVVESGFRKADGLGQAQGYWTPKPTEKPTKSIFLVGFSVKKVVYRPLDVFSVLFDNMGFLYFSNVCSLLWYVSSWY